MAIALTAKQRNTFASELTMQELAAEDATPKVFIVGDSPNASRTAESVYGTGVRPDLRRIFQLGAQHGYVHKAVMVGNPGLPERVVRHFEKCGFEVDLGLGPDCDDRVVSRCVEAAVICDVLICVGGDHAFVDILRLARQSRRKVTVIVMAVRQATHPCLLKSCDKFIELPVTGRSLAA
jgi:hypothetical protein